MVNMEIRSLSCLRLGLGCGRPKAPPTCPGFWVIAGPVVVLKTAEVRAKRLRHLTLARDVVRKNPHGV